MLYQSLFATLDLKEQLSVCFRHLQVSPIFGHGVVTLLLLVHLLLGHRRLQDMRYYQGDPLVKRLLGISRLPDVATVSRALTGMDGRSVEQLRHVCQQESNLPLFTELKCPLFMDRFARLQLASSDPTPISFGLARPNKPALRFSLSR